MPTNTIKKLFNPEGNDDYKKIYQGDTTNILDLNNIKYPFFIDLVDNVMYPNNWHPKKVDMTQDKLQYNKYLNLEEKEAYDVILSFLIFLDSIQTNNLPNIAENITLPEIIYFLARQTWDEALHSRSYGHILNNVVSIEKAKEIIYKWRDHPILLERNKKIAEIYQNAKDNPNDKNFVLGLIGNYLLEGLYFYNGFQFFHNLASRGLMIGTDIEIKYIQRDENTHLSGFKEIINNFKKEEPDIWNKYIPDIYKLFDIAVEWEKKFSLNVIGDKILGMSSESIIDYTHYLANRRLKEIGLEEKYDKIKNNPYKHLEKIAAIEDETSNRTNNFEMTSITYKTPEIIDGWDEI